MYFQPHTLAQNIHISFPNGGNGQNEEILVQTKTENQQDKLQIPSEGTLLSQASSTACL